MTAAPSLPEHLPYDIGAEAYWSRKHYSENPVARSDWRHEGFVVARALRDQPDSN